MIQRLPCAAVATFFPNKGNGQAAVEVNHSTQQCPCAAERAALYPREGRNHTAVEGKDMIPTSSDAVLVMFLCRAQPAHSKKKHCNDLKKQI